MRSGENVEFHLYKIGMCACHHREYHRENLHGFLWRKIESSQKSNCFQNSMFFCQVSNIPRASDLYRSLSELYEVQGATLNQISEQ